MNLPYTHLSLDERRELFRLRSAQIPMRVIAQRLSRHPSTPYREIKRNWFQPDLAGGASEPLHDPDPQSGPECHGSGSRSDGQAEDPARLGPAICGTRSRHRVRPLWPAQKQARGGELFLQSTGAVAERLDGENQWPDMARPIKLFLFVPYFHAGVSNEECRATSKPE